jgi:hypothetical protein
MPQFCSCLQGYGDQQQFSPQQIVNKSDHSDVWSFGIVLIELFTGMPADTNQKHIFQEVSHEVTSLFFYTKSLLYTTLNLNTGIRIWSEFLTFS